MSMTACLTQKRVNKICNECPSKIDSVIVVRDSIVYKDTTVYVDKRIVSYRDTIFCDSLGIVKPFMKVVKSNGLKATVKVQNNNITVDCETDSLKLVIDKLNKEVYRLESIKRTKVIEKNCNLEHRKDFDGFTYYWFIITFLLIAGYVIYKILKQRFNRFI